MPQIRPIPAIHYAAGPGADLSAVIAPPYDVLDANSKAALQARSEHNIATIDLPHLPAKTVGPDPVYAEAGVTFRQWLAQGTLTRRQEPALFVYQQTYEARGRTYRRQGLVANVRIQPFGRAGAEAGRGAVFPHEQTFSEPKEDRFKLMLATEAQLSPIFGLYGDTAGSELPLGQVVESSDATFHGTTANDQVLHEVWTVDDPEQIGELVDAMAGVDAFIADGHHRYTTAMNYRQALIESKGPLPEDHPANWCLFVLVSMSDPGMIVLPTHRVFGGMSSFSLEAFEEAGKGRLAVTRFAGQDLAALEQQLPSAGPHAIGLYNPAEPQSPLSVIASVEDDPLAATHSDKSAAWRALDVAIVQHLIVEQICQPAFCDPGEQVKWRFPHTLSELKTQADAPDNQLGLIMQPTPLASIQLVCNANEVMPQKSTFFFPKMATGLIINPLTGDL